MFTLDLFEPEVNLDPSPASFELRDYQRKAVDNTFAAWQECERALLAMATGLGKTIIASSVINDVVESGGRALFLANRDTLLDQAIEKMRDANGLRCDREQAGNYASFRSHVVAGSVQTLMGKRKERWKRDHFTHVFVDEAHYSLSDSFQDVLNYFSAKYVGLTATPDRGDKRNLGEWWQKVAFEYGLMEGIRDGHLAPIVAKTLPLKIDLTRVGKRAGDASPEELEEAIEPIIANAVDQIIEHASDRKTLIFLPLIKTSQLFAKLARERGIACEAVWGGDPDLDKKRRRFKPGGGTQWIANASIWSTGFDEPSIDCVTILRPTQVRSLFTQMVGRGTRNSPGKKNLLLLDFLWLTQKLSLVKAAHLVATSAEQAEKMTKILEASQGTFDLGLAQDQAIAEKEEEVREAHVRELSLKREMEKNAKKKSNLIDPVSFALDLHAQSLIDFEPTMPWEFDRPSPAQLATLEKAGINPLSVQNKGHASSIIETINTRRMMGLASMKQVNFLIKQKYPNPHTATFEEAKTYMGKLFATRRWGN